jgi:hypothetical protein
MHKASGRDRFACSNAVILQDKGDRMKGFIGRTVARALLVLTCELALLQPLWAQQGNEQFGLHIVVEKSNMSTPVKLVSPQPPAVLVEDRSGSPVANAIVVFTAPERGAGGTFDGGSRTKTVTTDRNGKAVATGFRANGTAGTYEIQVRAQFLGETAVGTVSHTNVSSGKSQTKLIAILAIAGAGAAGLIMKAGGGDGGSENLPTISLGGSTIGAPTP